MHQDTFFGVEIQNKSCCSVFCSSCWSRQWRRNIHCLLFCKVAVQIMTCRRVWAQRSGNGPLLGNRAEPSPQLETLCFSDSPVWRYMKCSFITILTVEIHCILSGSANCGLFFLGSYLTLCAVLLNLNS